MKVKEMRNKKKNQIQEMIRRGYFFNTVVILCLGVLIGFFALCLVHLIPVERMYDNAQVAQNMISEENTTYSVYGMKSTELDNYTDSIMVSTAICPKESSILEKVVYNYHSSYFKGYSEQENLRRYLVGEEGYDYSFYSHYWNGYLLFLKPLLFLFEYNDILMFNFMAQMLLVIWVIVGMVKKKKDFLILPFIVTMLSMGVPTATSLSIQLSDVLYVTLLGTGMIVWNYQKLDNRSIYFLFLTLGM
ncbi:MAG: hypothetical protein IJA36_02150, partial [Lachnospiraceae bacterium]|nr:hypothetical protein [Lachnospiraceae bacterium]